MSEPVEDVEMAEVDAKIMDTPQASVHSRISHSSFDSMDSGYLSLTPQSFGATPSTTNRHRSSTTIGKRHYWLRSEHWQADRRRSKLNTLINASDSMSEDYEEHELINRSIESLRDTSVNESRYNFRMNLREYRNRSRKSTSSLQRTTTAITPASLQLLSPPPSPAIPSASFVACEPIDEDIEKKLVIKQSTPYINLSPSSTIIPKISITFSPKTSKTSPINSLTSTDNNKKLSKLKLNDFGNNELIKPKRLDFSQRTYGGYKTRSTPDLTGKDNVDIIYLLGEKSNHTEIVSKILGYLRADDLCSVSMVSRAWRRICARDVTAHMRRITHVCVRQNTKENLRLIKKIKESNIQESPRSRYTRGCLIPVQNLLQVPPKRRPPNSPPVSPSKIKFHSFVKASRSLAPTERLFSCPKCTFACHVNNEKNVGTCTRKGCSTEFCTYCLSTPHTGACKTPLLATPTKRKTPPLVVGSKQSKRNLRRL